MPTIEYIFDGDAAPLDRAADVAEAALRGAEKAGRKTTKSAEDLAEQWVETGKSAAKMSSSIGKAEAAIKGAGHAADRTGDKLDGLHKVLEKSGVGPYVGDLKEMGAGLMAIGPAGAAALVGLAAVAGAAVGVAAVGYATLELARGAAAAAEETEHLASIIPVHPAGIEASKDLNAALDTMGGLAKRTGAALGAEVAVPLERVATVALAGGLAMADFANTSLGGVEALGRGVGVLIDHELKPYAAILVNLLNGAELLAKVTGQTLPAGLSEFNEQLAESVFFGGTFELVLGKVEVASGSYLDTASKMIAEQRALTEATGGTTGALGKQAAATVEAENAFNVMIRQAEAATFAENAAADAQNERARRQIENDLAMRASMSALTEEVVASVEVQRGAWESYFTTLSESTGMTYGQMAGSVAGSVGQILGSLEQLAASRQSDHEAEVARIQGERAENVQAYQEARAAYRDSREGMSADERAAREAELALMAEAGRARGKQLRAEQKEAQAAAVKAFQRQKLAALGQVLIDGSLAATKAIAQFGPPPSPPGIAALAAAATTTTASAVMIAAQKPPSFHRGGSPDEVAATLTRGEAVLSPKGVAAMGGEDGVRDLNRGQAPRGHGVTVIQLSGRTIDVIGDEIMGRRGAQLRATTGASKPGSRSGYRG